MRRAILLSLAFISSLQAAFSLVSTTFAGFTVSSQTLPYSLTNPSVAGDLIVGTVGGEGATCLTVVLPTATDLQGTSYTFLLKQLGTANEVSWAFYGTPATSGNNTISIDFGAGHACTNRGSYAQEWAGTKAGVTALDQTSSWGEAVGSTAVTSTSVLTTNAHELLICQARAFSNTRTFTAGTYDGSNLWNIDAQQATIGSSVAASASSSVTGIFACNMTLNSSAQWTAHILTFFPAAANVKHRVTLPD